MTRLVRLWLLRRELDRALRVRRAAREARSQAARRGHSTYWKRAGERCRELFAGAA